jgi:hypothetical protein
LRRYPTGLQPAELELSGVNRNQPPMCLRDLPMPPGELRAWADHYWPAGFREALGAGLFTPDGRHFGHLCLLTDSDRHPTDAARDLIGKLARTVADAVDPDAVDRDDRADDSRCRGRDPPYPRWQHAAVVRPAHPSDARPGFGRTHRRGRSTDRCAGLRHVSLSPPRTRHRKPREDHRAGIPTPAAALAVIGALLFGEAMTPAKRAVISVNEQGWPAERDKIGARETGSH